MSLPDLRHWTPQSDIVSLFSRIAETHESSIVITDLADTKYRIFPKLTEGPRTLVLLVPSQPKDTTVTLGKPFPPHEQFSIRQKQLKDAAPWIYVAPYFAKNIPALF